jgi:hypothetical protein
MACQIAIQQVVGQPLNGTFLDSITVTGTATGCSEVKVTINCRGNPISHQVSVLAGAWQAIFTGDDLKSTNCIECGNFSYPITVQASCADPGSLCTPVTLPLKEIPCASACPTISQIVADVPPCSSDAGGWNVTFDAYINGSGVTTCLWNFGDGTNPTVGTLPQGGVATIQHLYACAGSYSVSLTILSNCEPNYASNDTLLLELPTCGCPHISAISSNAAAGNPCAWNFMAKVGEPYLDCIQNYLWNFGDGNQQVTSTADATHTYGQSGSYAVTLTLQGPIGPVGGGVCYAKAQIQVSNCGSAGANGGGNGCPWWNPFCKGWSLCAALFAAAVVALTWAGFLGLLAGCILPLAVAGGPLVPAITAAVTSTLGAAAIATLGVGLTLLALWYLVCSKFPGYHFCSELTLLKNIISGIMLSQTAVGIALGIAGDPGCYIGAILTFGAFGTVLASLQLLGSWAGCP